MHEQNLELEEHRISDVLEYVFRHRDVTSLSRVEQKEPQGKPRDENEYQNSLQMENITKTATVYFNLPIVQSTKPILLSHILL